SGLTAFFDRLGHPTIQPLGTMRSLTPLRTGGTLETPALESTGHEDRVESGPAGVTDRAHSSGEQPRPPRAMSAERWERVQPVLPAALDCDSETRNAVLDRECGDDADVRRDVESLLRAQPDAGRVDRLLAGFAPAISRARASMLGWEDG